MVTFISKRTGYNYRAKLGKIVGFSPKYVKLLCKQEVKADGTPVNLTTPEHWNVTPESLTKYEPKPKVQEAVNEQ